MNSRFPIRPYLLLILIAIVPSGLLTGQTARRSPHLSVPQREAPFAMAFSTHRLPDRVPGEASGTSDDPGYAKYKEGYNFILEERWSAAREKFAVLIDQYPGSEYRDDAEYWSAYALRHLDVMKATQAYERFIRSFPKSKYLDDAVADLDQLHGDPMIVSTPNVKPFVYMNGGNGYVVGFSTDSLLQRINEFTLAQSARDLRKLERELRRKGKNLVRIQFPPSTPEPAVAPRALGFWAEEKSLDPKTRIKMDALMALGETRDDAQAFQTLKYVALDPRQPQPLRFAAIDGLSNFTKFDVMGVFVAVAKTDTNEEMQSLVVDYISAHDKDKKKSVGTLIDLFNNTPERRLDQRRRIFYSIAEIGNDRAVDFLATVARGNDAYELRREAVFYLGTIGGEKARAALYEILKETK